MSTQKPEQYRIVYNCPTCETRIMLIIIKSMSKKEEVQCANCLNQFTVHVPRSITSLVKATQ